ncbi:plant intracellular Ras-group-related LRR protein [Trifolium repens]|nr:plant intracellular Ras-group-related LRR protein [Trifolium repens]
MECWSSVDGVIEEIMKIHRSLPVRPGIDEVEAAKGLILNVENEDQISYSNGSASTVSTNFSKNSASGSHGGFDKQVPSVVASSSLVHVDKEVSAKASELFTRDDSYVSKSKTKSTFYPNGYGIEPNFTSKPQIMDSSLKSTAAAGQDGDKLSWIKLASIIEVSAKKGTRDLKLQGKLMDQVDWLPDSLGKITEIPDSVGNLLSLVYLDLRGNSLTTLPASLSRLIRLEELDLSSNLISVLPDSIGSLTNDIEELPFSIGNCSSLRELRADYNKLKALPEAVGKIESLEILSLQYNNVKQLPTTMSTLINLKELNVSFNELESIPESLCFSTSLVKINVGNNFNDMRYLPRSIGNLEMLEELDISNNQIRILPDSFRMLSKLRILRVEENHLEVPPREMAEKGAQAVVQYMAEFVEKRDKKDVKPQPLKQKKSWAQICFFSRSNKRKRDGADYVKA